MKRLPTAVLFFVLPVHLWTVPLKARAEDRPSNASVEAGALRIDEPLRDAALADLNGARIALRDLPFDRALVVTFSSIVCPASLKYDIHRAQIHDKYARKGVRLISVNANFNETAKDIRAHHVQNPVPFAVFQDPHNKLADHLGATHTPQAFLFDAHYRLRYKGEIDNGWGVPEDTTSRGLWDALDALLSRREIATPSLPSFGCEIRRAPNATSAASASTPTFYRDVLPVLQNRCQTCHRPGGIGRVSFLDYTEILAWAHQMRDSIEARIMPPWKARPEYGDFKNSRRLTDTEIRTFTEWVEGGMPKGNPADQPESRAFPTGWALGTPDLILKPEAPYALEAVGRDEYRCFVLPTKQDRANDVSAIEVLPGARAVVHHVSAYIDVSGKARLQQENAPGPGYPCFGGIGVPIYESLGGWAPGNTPFILPDGTGRHLPRDSDVILQIHYHKIGRAVEDHSRLGIYFAKKPVEKRLREEVINSRLLFIPPNVKRHRVTGAITIAQDQHLLGILPHMHLLGTEMKITATYPDGTQNPLIWVEPWDFNWQETYVYKTPVALPRGTRIALEAFYDNSADNPRNPNNPPRLVRWGENSTDEMCTAFLYVTRDDENLLKGRPRGDHR